jgi:DnaK suppressor protein
MGGVVLRKSELTKIRKMLLDMKENILIGDKVSSIEEGALDSVEMPDESDKASSATSQKIAFRIIERDRKLLKKIEKALIKFDEDEYGICERCEEEIDVKRLKARPVTTLCIDCKEDEERMEKVYQQEGE